MNLDKLEAQMNATLIFSIYYGDLEEEIVEELKNGIVLLFGRDDAIRLDPKTNLEIKLKPIKANKEIQFTVRKLFHLRIESEVFLSPF